MASKPTGKAYEKSGKFYARVVVGNGARRSVALTACKTQEAADARAELVGHLAAKLRKAGQVDVALTLLKAAGSTEGRALEQLIRRVDDIAAGKLTRERTRADTTIEELGKRWTSGELARLYKDHIRKKSTSDKDEGLLKLYVYPLVGQVRLADFTLDDADTVMRAIPAERSSATRRHVAQVLHRLFAMALFPLRIISTNPLPKGFLPKIDAGPAKGWLYPDEDARLLRSAAPLVWRVFYGFLHREGPRVSEAARLTWADFDLDRGAVNLDKNKTKDPRTWALSPGVTAALRAWRELQRRKGVDVGPDALVFTDEGEPLSENHLAPRFREHLQLAGIDRPALFERSDERRPIRLHDARATFITISLANGKSEAWVQDRTGHKSSIMVNRYRRAARTAAELNLGDLAPLVEVIPELSDIVSGGEGEPQGDARRGSRTSGDATQLVAMGRETSPAVPPSRQRKQREKRSGSQCIATDRDVRGEPGSPFKIFSPKGRPGSSPGGATERAGSLGRALSRGWPVRRPCRRARPPFCAAGGSSIEGAGRAGPRRRPITTFRRGAGRGDAGRAASRGGRGP
ncbi:tyrosine-type recombinase/integrase [Polyangium spumosum]|nr:tyrosine-type recombinase/integrase [Polyangium spumosum]